MLGMCVCVYIAMTKQNKAKTRKPIKNNFVTFFSWKFLQA